ncbi:hypothetical protein ACFWUW_29115 [Streptomyces sp. NPDC058655]|uniref:hypothetical protein n=1 Tax=Streptomyces sp. NPDC058655 TaxID=3346577 RepID=UPI0036629219
MFKDQGQEGAVREEERGDTAVRGSVAGAKTSGVTSVSRPEKDLIEYVRARADETSATELQAVEGWAYASVYHLILDVGRLFTPAPLPASLSRGYPGFCFSNAAATCQEQPGVELAYVEGFGSTPVDGHGTVHAPHGWASTPAGDTVDPTWPYRDGLAYLGIPFANPDDWPHPLLGGGLLVESRTLIPILRHGLHPGQVAPLGRCLSTLIGDVSIGIDDETKC